MMRRTMNLRFLNRPEGKEVVRVLQQQWVDEDPVDEVAIRYDWRDVPEESAPKPDAAETKAAYDFLVGKSEEMVKFAGMPRSPDAGQAPLDR